MNNTREMLIQNYQPGWAHDFNSIKEVIKEVLWDTEITIEHVGSTAVKDLAAKPIIDIDIVYGKNMSFKTIQRELEKLGYYHNGDQGIKEREAFKRKKTDTKHSVLDFITHHLYVCPVHSRELHRHILFRDYLIKNTNEREAYQKIKLEIAKKANQDKKVYAKLKETMAKEFIESVLEKAREENT
ncbi:GrpB family protein [Aquimarina megaterium]|uniref:GrpB family protein n=1 Tax=Aquimarina megaterium TaxID=1443666 RepID=UPI00046F54E6|nr:GrpB family protein [Aquimarina megaterium]